MLTRTQLNRLGGSAFLEGRGCVLLISKFHSFGIEETVDECYSGIKNQREGKREGRKKPQPSLASSCQLKQTLFQCHLLSPVRKICYLLDTTLKTGSDANGAFIELGNSTESSVNQRPTVKVWLILGKTGAPMLMPWEWPLTSLPFCTVPVASHSNPTFFLFKTVHARMPRLPAKEKQKLSLIRAC